MAESIHHALEGLATRYEVQVGDSEVRVEVMCGECAISEICPLPYYISSYVEKATSKRLVLREWRFEGGKCTITYKVSAPPSRNGEPTREQ